MNRRLPILFLLILAMACGVYFLAQKEADSPQFIVQEPKEVTLGPIPEEHQLPEDPESENPMLRLQYEYDMLKSPRTGKIPDGIRRKELKFARTEMMADIAIANAVDGADGTDEVDFISEGPFNLGGRTRGIGIDVNDPNTIIAAGVSGGVWRTTDGGASWNRASSLQDFPSVTAIIQDTRAGNTNDWYFSGGEFFGNSASEPQAFYFGDGIFKSTDNGVTWSVIPETESGQNTDLAPFSVIHELALDASNANETEIYAAGVSSIFRTVNGFESSIVTLGSGNTGFNFSDVAVTSTGRVYATISNSDGNGANAEEGVFTSTDGINWTNIDPPTLPATYGRLEIGINPTDEGTVYIVGTNVLFRYDQPTDTWTDLTGQLFVSNDAGQGHDAQGGYNLFVSVHPGVSNTVFVGGTNVLRSTDGFTSNTNRTHIGGYVEDTDPSTFQDYENHHPDQHVLKFMQNAPNVSISGNDGGIFRTDNNLGNASGDAPVTWSSLNNGYLTTQFYAIDYEIGFRGSPLIPGGMQDNGSYINFTGEPDGDWVRGLGGDGTFSGITYNSLYFSAQQGQLIRFELVDNTFESQGFIIPTDDLDEFIFVNPFIYDQVNQDKLFVGALGRVYFTRDVRQNPTEGEWQSISGSGLSGDRVSALATSVQPEGILYFGTRAGAIYKVDDTRTQSTAVEITGSNQPAGVVNSIAVDPLNGDRVIAAYVNYDVVSIWLSEDGGDSWSSISGNLEENANGTGDGPSVRSVAIMPKGDGTFYYFAGTSVGLFMTTTLDGDNTVWELQGPNQLGNTVVNMIKTRQIDGHVLAATHGNGVWRGNYEFDIEPQINYSQTGDEEFTLRAPVSGVNGQGFIWQWLLNGEPIDGATNPELVVTNGGTYRVAMLDQLNQEREALSNEVFIDLDRTAPEVSTIVRLDPTDQETSANMVTFQVTFNETVMNVDAADFETTGDASGTIMSATEIQAGTTWDVVVGNIGGAGSLGLGFSSSNNIQDLSGNAFGGTIGSAETYTIIDGAAPTVAITRQSPTSATTDQVAVTFEVTFNEQVVNVDVSDFALSSGSVASANIGGLTEVTAGRVYRINIVDIAEDGLVDLDIVGTDIADASGNAFAGDITTEETFTIENNVTSIDDRLLSNVEGIVVDANPSTGIFNIALNENYARGFKMRIVDGGGNEVMVDEQDSYEPESQLTLDLTKLPDGLYILNVSNETRKDVIKLLKRSN